MTIFDQCFAAVIGVEGGLSMDPEDPGNWTGGARDIGELRGTNWGISAAAYPKQDIAALTQQQAAAIYQRDYWNKCCCAQLPAAIALTVFDGAVNSGVAIAARWLQAAVGAAQDGWIGPVTLSLVAEADAATICIEINARRIVADALLPEWTIDGLGWARRVCALPFKALSLTA